MTPIAIIFYAFLAFIAIGSAVSMLVSRNAIHAALFLVLNFATIAVFYLSLSAPFIALTQITVYAGAIMVLFLFVIALLGAEKLPGYEPIKGQRITALILALIFVVEIVMFTIFKNQITVPLTALSADFASPKAIGISLFTEYLLPFEMVAVILLSAAVGAIVLTKPEKKAGINLSRREP